jgi:hypothetical protein
MYGSKYSRDEKSTSDVSSGIGEKMLPLVALKNVLCLRTCTPQKM